MLLIDLFHYNFYCQIRTLITFFTINFFLSYISYVSSLKYLYLYIVETLPIVEKNKGLMFVQIK